jgi:hypothetical protein
MNTWRIFYPKKGNQSGALFTARMKNDQRKNRVAYPESGLIMVSKT